MVWLFTCSSAAWLSDRAVWSHTWSRWCWRAGSWMVGLFIMLILVSLHWRSPSALTSFSRVNEPTFNLQISHSHHYRLSSHPFHVIVAFHYPFIWLDSGPLLVSASWHSSLSRSRCSGLLTPNPVFRISDWTAYSLITVLIPGTCVTRTYRNRKQFAIT